MLKIFNSFEIPLKFTDARNLFHNFELENDQCFAQTRFISINSLQVFQKVFVYYVSVARLFP